MTIREFMNNFIGFTYILSSFDFNISFKTITLVLDIVSEVLRTIKDQEASQTCPCEGISDI